MSVSLRPQSLKRYRDLGRLVWKYGRGMLKDQSDAAALWGDEAPPDDATSDDAEAFAAELEKLGPTFIKLGQLLSTRADLIPPVYLEALSRLQDKVEPLGFDVIESIVQDELGARISNAFSEFKWEPLASASLGQVHQAALRDGRLVAVKVQRPGIREQALDDLQAIESIASFLDEKTEVGRRYGFGPMVDHFRRSLMRELDYRTEAENLRLIATNLAEFDRIVVPQPIDDYTTGRVLTMEFVRGRKVTSIGPLGQQEIDGTSLAEELFSAYLKQVVQDGVFHADPHPGNVFVTDDGRLALIDLGMVARITPRTQDALIRLLLALSESDAEEAASVFIATGDHLEHFDEAAVRQGISEVMWGGMDRGMGQMEVGGLVAQLLRVAGEHGLRPPHELTMLGKTLLNLDQIATTLDPNFNPTAAMQRDLPAIVSQRVGSSLSPANLMATVTDFREFVEKLPKRMNKILDTVGDGKFKLEVEAFDERELLRGVHAVANRVTLGIVLAALIVGAAMLMRVETDWQILGYPGIAMILFLIAAVGALWLAATIIFDRPRKRRDGVG